MSKGVEWGPNCTALRAQAWNLKVSPKIKHFFWQVASGSLAVTTELKQNNMNCENTCQRCGKVNVTIYHAMFECPHSLQVWTTSRVPLAQGVFPTSSVFSNLIFLYWKFPSQENEEENFTGFLWIMWFIWKVRNKLFFEGIQSEPLDSLRLALSEKLSDRWFMKIIGSNIRFMMDVFLGL